VAVTTPWVPATTSAAPQSWSTYVSVAPSVAPSGTGAYASSPSSGAGSNPCPSCLPVTGGAGRVGAMIGAAFVPALFALF
jgi:hypothetical protein